MGKEDTSAEHRCWAKEEEEDKVYGHQNASIACHVHQVAHSDRCRNENAEQSRCAQTGAKSVPVVVLQTQFRPFRFPNGCPTFFYLCLSHTLSLSLPSFIVDTHTYHILSVLQLSFFPDAKALNRNAANASFSIHKGGRHENCVNQLFFFTKSYLHTPPNLFYPLALPRPSPF